MAPMRMFGVWALGTMINTVQLGEAIVCRADVQQMCDVTHSLDRAYTALGLARVPKHHMSLHPLERRIR